MQKQEKNWVDKKSFNQLRKINKFYSMNFLQENFIQQKQILNSVLDFLQSGTGQTIHIYGMPGTGKTYTVKNIIEIFQSEKEISGSAELIKLLEQIRKFKFSIEYFNCAKKRSFPEKIYWKKTILIFDEIDILKNENLLYSIFDIPYNYPVLLLCISNMFTSHHLTNKVSDKVISRMGNNKIKFEPYSSAELEKISGNRCLAKYLSTFGDMRRVKNTTELKNFDGKNTLKKIKEIFEPQYKRILRCLNQRQKLILRIALENKFTYEEFIYRCNLLNMDRISYNEYLFLEEELEEIGFLKNKKVTYMKEEIINYL